MSRKVLINSLDDESLNKVSKDLCLRLEPGKYAMNAPPQYIYAYENNDTDVYVPFSYDKSFPRPERKELKGIDVRFVGKLRPDQEGLKSEAVKHLNKYGSSIIAAYPGYGKCLQKNTPILLFDGSIKLVQEIKTDDLLMGDDSTPRKVLSICTGEEQMFKIIKSNGESFGANKSHVLSLCISPPYRVEEKKDRFNLIWFDKTTMKVKIRFFSDRKTLYSYTEIFDKDPIVDMAISDYLELDHLSKSFLKSYKVSVEFEEKDVPYNPYIVGKWIVERDSRHLEFFKHSIPDEYKTGSKSSRLLLLGGIVDSVGTAYEDHYELKLDRYSYKDIHYVAMSVGFRTSIAVFSDYINLSLYGDLNSIPSKLNGSHNTETDLLFDFKIVPISDREYFGFTLDGNGRFLLGDFTVTHNTATGIFISTCIRLKTLIIVHRVVLVKQWEKSIKKFCPGAKIQVLSSKSKKEDNDFYIMNAVNVPKKDRSFFSDIGFLIVDEAHIIMAKMMSKCMSLITPRYLLGLSATPYRFDGLNVLLSLYFGDNKIIRELYRKHTVYKIRTKFKPTVELNKMGKINWGVILDSQANHQPRNEMIIRIIKHFKDIVFLGLTKRVDQANYIHDRLLEEKESVTSLIGKQQDFDIDSRIVIGTGQKTGIGFDHDTLNGMILCADVEQYFVQYLGRVFRREDVEPVIFDIVDSHPILERHSKSRDEVFIKHGGRIKDFSLTFPDIEIC